MADGADDKWWEKNIAGNKIDIPAEAEVVRTKSGKIKKVIPKGARRSPLMQFVAVIIRILSLLAGAAMLFFGGWSIYKLVTGGSIDFNNEKAGHGAMAAFLILIGVMTVVVEMRSKCCMRGCLNVFIIVANYLARGFVYLITGGLIFWLKEDDLQLPKQVKVWYGGVLCIVAGLANILYYIFYYRHRRNKAIVLQPKYIANAEEIAYGMNLYDPDQRRLEEEKRAASLKREKTEAVLSASGTVTSEVIAEIDMRRSMGYSQRSLSNVNPDPRTGSPSGF